MAKSTNAEIESRIRTVYGLLIKSYSRFEILQYAAEQWSVSERTADIYMQRARQLIQQDAEIERLNGWLLQSHVLLNMSRRLAKTTTFSWQLRL